LWGGFPLGTLFVNLLGGLGIGLAMAWLGRHPDEGLRLLLVTGLLGGFTTFSAFSAESLGLLEKGDLGGALFHTLVHVVGALGCAALGARLMRTWWL
jgi:CrcB protein